MAPRDVTSEPNTVRPAGGAGSTIRPGVAVVQFLEPVPPGQRIEPLLADLAGRIEPASLALYHEAGGEAALAGR